ncbi:hypothetical protein [Maridesulfovibrio sp.]|uniref:hypothetical protein n=1 Tax=Maridesulfovibrio sp. TaxID=2795000 RepID=UPI002A18CD4B|nr:hypothetical protein [Maridesulfovibrio sp.]
MTGVESLISMHRKDMSLLRDETRKSNKERKARLRDMDQAFSDLRGRLSAEMPTNSSPLKFRGAVAFMITLLGVLSY